LFYSPILDFISNLVKIARCLFVLTQSKSLLIIIEMALLFFWLKIAAKRIAYLIKRSPVSFIGLAVILAAFYIGRNDIKRYMDMQTEIAALSFFVFVSLLISFRNYRTMPSLMIYSKSGMRNNQIRAWFFVRKALANNIMLLLTGFAALIGILITEYPPAIPAAFLLSLLLSFSVMRIKNAYTSDRINKIAVKKVGFGPAIKGTIHDYFSSDFLQMTVLSISLFAALAVLLLGNIGSLYELENPSIIFISLLIILSLGFGGFIDSVSHINWKFHAIIFPHDFSWHIKRAAVFLCALFSLPMLLFVFMAFFFGFALFLKYLYCTIVMLLLSINIAFMANGKLTKALLFFIPAMVFTAWISTLQAPFLLILAALVLLTFFKANNEYKEWYYL